MIRLEVKRQPNESTSSLLRRFSKRVQGSGMIKRAKALRFTERKQSYFKRKRAALVRLERRQGYERLKKLGKI
ncbi:MAG: 30S ribosomal protein S21 [Patescibacteria group bacterium]